MPEQTAPRRENAFFRRLAHWGALSGPESLVRFSPKPIGAAFGVALPALRRRIVRNLRRVYGRRAAWREQLDAVDTLANYAACFAEAIASGRKNAKPRVNVRAWFWSRRMSARGTSRRSSWARTWRLMS
jgi:lauroyl/myristoyl acyltransferase